MKTVNNPLPKISRIHLFEVFFQHRELHFCGNFNSNEIWNMNVVAHWAYYIIINIQNWILCQFELNFLFYFDLAQICFVAIVISEMRKRSNNKNNNIIYGNHDECIKFINYVYGIFVPFKWHIFELNSLSSQFSLQGNWLCKEKQSIFVSINFCYAL